ncbi:MAG: tape measure protein, partial [Clostridia bacterium]
MAGDGVIIKIDGDDAGFRQKMQGVSGIATKALHGVTAVAKGTSLAMGALSAAAGAAWSAVGVVGVKYNAQIEQLQTSFTTMTGSAEEAASIVERIKALGASTPFETVGLAETVQLLMNYGLTADAAIGRMTMLGDVAQGNSQKMNRLATAYGQMSSAGKVSLEDVKQMIEAGFNPLQEISQATGESMASLYARISKGTLAVDEITQAMVRATSEGGKYFGGMDAQSRTLNGLLSTLKDGAAELAGGLFDPITDALRERVLPGAIQAVDELKEVLGARGIDGVIDSITGKLPALLSAGAEMARFLARGAAKAMPSALKGFTSALPGLLKSIVGAAPEMVAGGMAMLSQLARGLVAQLPEIVPILLDGLAGLGGALLTGAGDVIDQLFKGIFEAFSGQGDAFERSIKQGDPLKTKMWADAFDKVDIGLDASVTDGVTPTVKGAVTALKKALEGIDVLDDATRTKIIQLIGDDVDPILAALQGAGVDTTTPEGSTIAGKVTAAAVDLHRAIMAATQVGQGMDLKALAGTIDGGKQAIIDALVKAGATQAEAETAATQITTAKESLTTACGGMDSIVPSDIATIISAQKSSLVTALSGMGLTDAEIAPIVTALTTAQGTLKAQVSSVYDTIYAKLTDGIEDTEADKATLKTLAQGYFDDLMGELDLSTKEGQQYADTLKSLQAQTLAYIETMSNEQTNVVRKTKGDLDALKAEAQKTHGEIMGWVAEANAASQTTSVRMVKSGTSSAPTKVKEAFEVTQKDYKVDRTKIAEGAQKLRDEADDEWDKAFLLAMNEDDPATRDAILSAANEKHQERTDEIAAAEKVAAKDAENSYRQN